MTQGLTTPGLGWAAAVLAQLWAATAVAQVDFTYADPAPLLNIVAHQDDDLLGMNPAINATIATGAPVRTVYLTAGNANWDCAPYALGREAGIRDAYKQMASAAGLSPGNWVGVPEYFNTRKVIKYTLSNTTISLIFMRLQNAVGPFFPGSDLSLTEDSHGGDLGLLWHGDVASVTAFPMGSPPLDTAAQAYTKAQLIDALTEIIADFGPAHVNLLDATELTDFESPDHVHSAMFGMAALQAWAQTATVRMHETYNPTLWPGNLPAGEAAARTSVFQTYAAHDPRIANPSCGAEDPNVYAGVCPGRYMNNEPLNCEPYLGFYSLLEDVFYAIGAVHNSVGRIATPGGLCLTVADGQAGTAVRAQPCGSGGLQRWELSADRTVKLPGVGGRCLRQSAPGSGQVVLGGCSGERAQFVLFDIGQLRGPGALCAQVVGATAGTQLSLYHCNIDDVDDQVGFGLMFGAPTKASAGSSFNMSQVSSHVSQYSTLALTKLPGDAVSDACVRRSGGVYCAEGNGGGFNGGSYVYGSDFNNWNGWGNGAYGSTVQFVDIDNQHGVDLCGRGAQGVRCAKALPAGGYGPAEVVTDNIDFSDFVGYGASESYYRALGFADVTGDGFVDICSRNAWGIECATNKGNHVGSFHGVHGWTNEFSDALGWGPSDHGATIMFGDVNGDRKADVCGRGAQGVRCALSDGGGFGRESLWGRGDMSDLMGWSWGEQYWGSLRLVDVDGDGRADVCGRGVEGLRCHLNWGYGFGQSIVHVDAPGLTDLAGWGSPEFGATLAFDATGPDGVQRLCARGPEPGTGSFWSGPNIVLMCADR